MNSMAEAFAEAAAAKREECGEDVVILNGNHIADALVDEITTDEVVMAGGNGDEGGCRVQILISAVAQQPAKDQTITVNGREWDVLSVIERNRATYEIICGSIVTEDR